MTQGYVNIATSIQYRGIYAYTDRMDSVYNHNCILHCVINLLYTVSVGFMYALRNRGKSSMLHTMLCVTTKVLPSLWKKTVSLSIHYKRVLNRVVQ